MRSQFVLDRKTNRLLEQLAADRGGNRSRVVRAAIQRYAEMEAHFDAMEEDPGFIAMMEKSESDFKAGRYVTLGEFKKQLRGKRRKAR